MPFMLACSLSVRLPGWAAVVNAAPNQPPKLSLVQAPDPLPRGNDAPWPPNREYDVFPERSWLPQPGQGGCSLGAVLDSIQWTVVQVRPS